MIRMTGYDTSPEAMVLPEAVCVICDELCGRDDIAQWIDFVRDAEAQEVEGTVQECTPMLPVHKGICDRRLSAAVKAFGAMDWWDQLGDVADQFQHNVGHPPVIGVEVDGSTLLRRRPRSVNLRRTADLLDWARSAAVR